MDKIGFGKWLHSQGKSYGTIAIYQCRVKQLLGDPELDPRFLTREGVLADWETKNSFNILAQVQTAWNSFRAYAKSEGIELPDLFPSNKKGKSGKLHPLSLVAYALTKGQTGFPPEYQPKIQNLPFLRWSNIRADHSINIKGPSVKFHPNFWEQLRAWGKPEAEDWPLLQYESGKKTPLSQQQLAAMVKAAAKRVASREFDEPVKEFGDGKYFNIILDD
jgi:hypothetical protein